MSNIVKFPRQQGFRGAVRSEVTAALRSVGKPIAVVVVALSDDGQFSIRAVSTDAIKDFDMYSRAGAVCERQRHSLLEQT